MQRQALVCFAALCASSYRASPLVAALQNIRHLRCMLLLSIFWVSQAAVSTDLPRSHQFNDAAYRLGTVTSLARLSGHLRAREDQPPFLELVAGLNSNFIDPILIKEALCHPTQGAKNREGLIQFVRSTPNALPGMSMIASLLHQNTCVADVEQAIVDELFLKGGIAAIPRILGRYDASQAGFHRSKLARMYAYGRLVYPPNSPANEPSFAEQMYGLEATERALDVSDLPPIAQTLAIEAERLKDASFRDVLEIGKSLLDGTLGLTDDGVLVPETGTLGPFPIAARGWLVTALYRAKTKMEFFEAIYSLADPHFTQRNIDYHGVDTRLVKVHSDLSYTLVSALDRLITLHHSVEALHLAACIITPPNLTEKESAFVILSRLKGVDESWRLKQLNERVFDRPTGIQIIQTYEGGEEIKSDLTSIYTDFMPHSKVWTELDACGLPDQYKNIPKSFILSFR